MLEDYVVKPKRNGQPTIQMVYSRPSEPSVLQTLYDDADRTGTLHDNLHEPGSFVSLA